MVTGDALVAEDFFLAGMLAESSEARLAGKVRFESPRKPSPLEINDAAGRIPDREEQQPI
jgi:hypothetical protein